MICNRRRWRRDATSKLETLVTNFFFALIQFLVSRWYKCLKVGGGYLEVWCVQTAAHVPCIRVYPSQNRILGIRVCIRVRLKCDGTRAEGLSAKRTSPFKSAGASVQSIGGSRVVRISGSNAGYTKFRGNVKRCDGDWLPTPFASFPFTSPPVRHRVSSRFNWTLPCPF